MLKSTMTVHLSQQNNEKRKEFTIKTTHKKLFEGYVIDENGKPLANVTVKLVDQHFNPIIHSLTTKTGYYLLIGDSKQNTQLIIAKKNYQTQRVSPCTNKPNKIILVQQNLVGCDVLGRIQCEDPCNLQQATLILDKNKKAQLTSPDPSGRFVFAQLESGRHELVICKENCALVQICFFIKNKQRTLCLDKILLKKKNEGCTLHGLICDNLANPINNATVFLFCAVCHHLHQKTRTDSQGLYFFGNLNPGSYYIKAVE